MKDRPAALLVALSVRDTELMHRVVDNGRVLRTVFPMIRSGQFKKIRLSLREGTSSTPLGERGDYGCGRVGLSSSVQRAFHRQPRFCADVQT